MPHRHPSDAPPSSKPTGLLRRILGAFSEPDDEPSLTHAVLDAVPDAIIVVDADDRIRLANNAATSILGYEPQDLVGIEFASTMLPLGSRKSHRARVKQHADGALEAAPPSERQSIVRADGTELDVDLTMRAVEGAQPLLGITIRDATRANDLEGAVEATDARRRTLRTIVDALPDPVVAVDRNDRVVLRNKAAHQLGDDGLSDQWWNEARAVIRSGDPVFDREEPSEIGVQLTTRVPVRNRAGEVAGLVVISRDVTEQKAGEARLLADMEAAEAAAQANREFLATTSHEVRTLMSGVTGMTMLLLNTDLDEEQREYVDTVRTSSTALLTVINDVLDFSKIESGMLHLEDEPFDARALTDEALRMVAQQATGKGLALEADVDDRVPASIRGDAGRVRQVLVNLLSNAVKFTSEGSVQIRVEPTVSPAGQPALQFAVRDTGIGIAADRLEAIFEEFIQAETSTARTHGGTGLGLAICRRLVDMMGGQMSAESVPGGGSIFRFTIALEAEADAPEPMAAAWISKPTPAPSRTAFANDRPPQASTPLQAPVAPPPVSAPPPLTEAPADKPLGVVIPMDDIVPLARILLAEDNPVNQKVTSMTLRRLGYQPTIVSDGAQAVEAVRTDAYDVVLMDIMMPVMTGLEATAAICEDWGPHSKPTIVALTANAMKGDRQDCLDAGCDYYLAKPVAPEQLASTIERVVRERGEAVPA